MDDCSRKIDLEHFSNWFIKQTSFACKLGLYKKPKVKGLTLRDRKVNVGQYSFQRQFSESVHSMKGIPTAAVFLVAEKELCIFCEKLSDSAICSRAADMPIEDKR